AWKRFWDRFHSDSDLANAMRAAWKNQRHTQEQIKRSSRLGGEGLWRKYHADPAFKKELDDKLRESRSRGGTKSLWKLSEASFKRRLDGIGKIWVKARFSDSWATDSAVYRKFAWL